MSEDFVVEPERLVPVVYEADVAVAGGGLAGIIVALAAARAGSRTILIDRFDCPGGNIGPGFFSGGSLVGGGCPGGSRGYRASSSSATSPPAEAPSPISPAWARSNPRPTDYADGRKIPKEERPPAEDAPPADFPLRAMIPKELDGLIAVGRSASSIPDTLLRTRPFLMHVGQAGGAAAALAAQAGVAPRLVDICALQKKLVDEGFYLGDDARLAELGLT